MNFLLPIILTSLINLGHVGPLPTMPNINQSLTLTTSHQIQTVVTNQITTTGFLFYPPLHRPGTHVLIGRKHYYGGGHKAETHHHGKSLWHHIREWQHKRHLKRWRKEHPWVRHCGWFQICSFNEIVFPLRKCGWNEINCKIGNLVPF